MYGLGMVLVCFCMILVRFWYDLDRIMVRFRGWIVSFFNVGFRNMVYGLDIVLL